MDIFNTTKVEAENCALSKGDNTSSLGWMRRLNSGQKGELVKSGEVEQQLGRHLAYLTLKTDIILYKQWLR